MELVDIGGVIEAGKANTSYTFGAESTGQVKRLPGGTWVAWACLPREGQKPLYLVATTEEKVIRAAIMGRYRAAGVNVGAWGFLKKIKNIAKKIARAKVFQKIGSAIKKVANNPIIAKAVGLAQFIPGVGQVATAALTATKAASKLLAKAKGGSPQAKAAIKTTITLARRGNPAARKSVAVMRAVARGRGRVVAAQRRGQRIPGILYQGRPVMVGGDLYADGLNSM